MNLRAMNMLYESIVKRGSLMVVPSGLADSLNVPAMMGMMGGAGHVPRDGGAEAAVTAGSGATEAKATAPDASREARKEH